MVEFTSRLAVSADVPALTVLMDAAIAELQRAFLDDGTYFVVESDGDIAGCGGWSRRATLYGGDETPGRNSNLLERSSKHDRLRLASSLEPRQRCHQRCAIAGDTLKAAAARFNERPSSTAQTSA